jgi:hypothetical protein
MVKCDEGYLCGVCGEDVAEIGDSDLYLRFVAGLLEAEVLHTTPERHIRCNPSLAQFIVDAGFEPVVAAGEFDKSLLDPAFRIAREDLISRAWVRLQSLSESGLPIHKYPLPEIQELHAG